jgi:hypothetical protein
MNEATSLAFAYSTSPTQRIPDFLVESKKEKYFVLGKLSWNQNLKLSFLPSTALVPTSITTAPGLIQLPLMSSALPAAATTISAFLTYFTKIRLILIPLLFCYSGFQYIQCFQYREF